MPTKPMNDDIENLNIPKTGDEWQMVVDGAHALLSLESARQYGLVTGGPEVNVDRCELLLSEGAKLGYIPTPDAVEKFVSAIRVTRLKRT